MKMPNMTRPQALALLEAAERYRLLVTNDKVEGYEVKRYKHNTVHVMALDNALYIMREKLGTW